MCPHYGMTITRVDANTNLRVGACHIFQQVDLAREELVTGVIFLTQATGHMEARLKLVFSSNCKGGSKLSQANIKGHYHEDFADFFVKMVLKLLLSTFPHKRNAPRTPRGRYQVSELLKGEQTVISFPRHSWADSFRQVQANSPAMLTSTLQYTSKVIFNKTGSLFFWFQSM